MTINLDRRGTMHGFWTPDSPPTIPAAFPLPAALRRTMDAADQAETAIAEAVQTWETTHAAMADPPRPSQDKAEDAAWYTLTDMFPAAVAAMQKALDDFRAWLADHQPEAAAWELSRLEAWRTAEAKAKAARAEADRAAHDVGETWRVSQGYVLDRYAHDERPRSIRGGDYPSNPLEVERVEAYYRGISEGGDQSAPLPGDTVTTGLDGPVRRRRATVLR